MNELSLEARIEAVLFARSEPLGRVELCKLFRTDPASVDRALADLKEKLVGRGIALVDDGREVELRVAPEAVALIETLRKEELSHDIGKAGLETLAILLYKGPSTRSQIDFIRGVNSSYILRALAMRGLIRRKDNPDDERSFLYEPTTDLLATLGVAHREDLPDFGAVARELETLMRTAQQPNNHVDA